MMCLIYKLIILRISQSLLNSSALALLHSEHAGGKK